MHSSQLKQKGYFVIMILVFGSVFLLMLTAFTGLLVSQKRSSGTAVERERALHIAEAGLEYYRWYLAHNPGDITNGTTTPQPYIHRYTDPQTGEVGQFELTVEGAQSACGYIGAVDITSVGRLDSDPDKPRAIFGRYTRPNVAEYAAINNVGVWVGGGTEISGRWHSNGGVRMQGYNDSVLTSAVETWLCTSSYGCTPDRTVPGIYGSGDDSLWQYPVPPIDFEGMAVDLLDIKTRATSGGRYFGSVSVPPPSSNTFKGYQVIFKSDGTFDVFKVKSNAVDTTWAYDEGGGGGTGFWFTDEILKSSQTTCAASNPGSSSCTRVLVGNYTIPDNCSVLFFEDRVWLEGVITKKVTMAVGDLVNANTDRSAIIQNNITYSPDDGTAGFLLFAENDVVIPLNMPNNMTINGIFVAQKGAFGRHKYCPGNCSPDRQGGSEAMNSSYTSHRMKDSLTINGTRVSYGKAVFYYSESTSGVRDRTYSYDTDLIDDPPPLIPSTSEDYRFTIWEEVPVEE